jgi:small-conductance mechanosensitive channel
MQSVVDLLAALVRPAALAELAALALCVALAWGAVRLTRVKSPGGIWFGRRGVDGVLFPLLMLAFALIARQLLQPHVPIAVFKVAIPILVSLAIVRTTARVLHLAFPKSPLVHAVERTLSWFVWAAMVLWITDLLPQLLEEMEAIHWRMGGTNVSLRSLIEGILTAGAALVLTLWLSATIESWLLAGSRANLSVRKIAATVVRAVLLLIGLLIALSAAGIPLAALGVLGGAVGVGIGFGLQKLAANYVSGFVILAERSVRIGDVVKVDNFEGRISDIKTRYTVIRAIDGRESIVPNEMLITQRVENCTFADAKVAMNTEVQVAYGTDLDRLLPALQSAVQRVPRVLADPAPVIHLSNFAADGLELTVVFWIADIHSGQASVRSDVNLVVLRCLGEQGVEIPYPQRVVRQG